MELKERSNFFLVTYEELQQNPRGSVKRLCQILGKDLNSQQIDSVVENASFQKMKDNRMSNFSLVEEEFFRDKTGKFMRKGKSRAWVIYVLRNPKDVLVSHYHFSKLYKGFQDPGTMEEFLETFLTGNANCQLDGIEGSLDDIKRSL
ncbi:hypothetical protein JD844_005643 [Phrynosoma platyrhinos]|uniref:Sulfotransferase n=1 Tax=Phrynosoma platyrhinos TaxID=52577 RepID=A0ABQ7TP52_PHRPL|nr:hypothetical protein JD844_005643 [Phrynosoma platyrhinos]